MSVEVEQLREVSLPQPLKAESKPVACEELSYIDVTAGLATIRLQACRAAEEELAAVRQKLRNAVKKGKAIDEERHGLQQRVLELEETLSKAEAPGEARLLP